MMNSNQPPESVSPQDLARMSEHFARSYRPDVARKFLTLAKRLHISQKIQAGTRPTVRIYSTSDDAKDEFTKLLWGDYWVQYELVKCFGSRGYPISKINPDVIIHLFGFPAPLPKLSYNIAWIYSHPDYVQPQFLPQYDFIFSLSEPFRMRLLEMGFQSQILLGATSKEPYPPCELKYPAVFVGNARPRGDIRPAVQCLTQSSYPFLVWGDRWDQYLPPDRIGGVYYDNQRLDRLYAMSAFSINDHHEDMRRYGFVAVKIFDILASGGFAVSDSNPGIESIFGDTVPQFSTAKDLQRIFNKYAPGTTEREQLRKRGQEIALSHTWDDRVTTFIEHMERAFDPDNLKADIRSALSEHP
ncbi:MAG: glycosyltransferase [bacterium]